MPFATEHSGLTLRQRLDRGFIVLAILGLALMLTLIHSQTALEKIRAKGVLTVITRNSPTTYFLAADGPNGFEYDLAKAFADELGVKLNLVVPSNFSDILPMIVESKADLAAAGLTLTQTRSELVEFGPGYQEITQQLIYRTGKQRPKSVNELIGHQLKVIAGSSHAEKLRELKQTYPRLTWAEHDNIESEELMGLVWDEVIDYTIADSNEAILNRRLYPKLQVAFDLSEPQQLAWAFPKTKDKSVLKAAQAFFKQIRSDGTLDAIVEKHYSHAQRLGFVGTQTFIGQVSRRLPRYQHLFEEIGLREGIDWRLLAAIGYQESFWNPTAKSPTGVRGMMMLTQRTANQLGITNRLDPRESVDGGARYYKMMRAKIPERIAEPDRTWFALAAYNVGFGHLEDARKLTQTFGDDPDSWVDVRKHLPLLRKRKWHTKTRHGYARGNEPVEYVDNIRSYYDVLIWLDNDRQRNDEIIEENIDYPPLPQSL